MEWEPVKQLLRREYCNLNAIFLVLLLQVKNLQAFEVLVNIEESQNITLLRVPELRNDIDEGGNAEGSKTGPEKNYTVCIMRDSS